MWRFDERFIPGERLMLNYRDGDEDAFDTLYRRYRRPLLDFIYRMVMNAADAEDLCQEAFLRVVRGKKKYEVTAQFKTWLFQIALNLCRGRLRRMKHRSHLSLNASVLSQDDEEVEFQELIPDTSPDPVECVETNELETIVQQAIASLPEDQRSVVILREYQGLKLSEIAEIMNCPVGTVKSLNHRAHQKLEKILAKYID